MVGWKLGAALALTLSVGGAEDPRSDRIYARVLTNDGAMLEGYVRWDRNEASWTDFLDANKEIPEEHLREAESLDLELAAARRRDRSIEAFGVRISWDIDDDAGPTLSSSGVRFGHIATLTPVDNRHAVIRMTSGEEVRLRGASTDLGRTMRELIVDDLEHGETTLRWREIQRIDFMAAPSDAAPPPNVRLHGTVTTANGLEMTGYVSWDLDEALESDVLDGRMGREDYEIPFAEIAEIHWESARSARVALRSGEELVLRGSNDVDRTNRGIEVSDAVFGRVKVRWQEFESVVFHPSDGDSGSREAFGPNGPLTGTVEALDGRVLVGEIRWDNDETAGWETLNGWSGNVELDIEFGAIRVIERTEAGEGVTVRLRDGRSFDLVDSNDVSDENRGIFVKPDGRARRLVRWRDFARLEFNH